MHPAREDRLRARHPEPNQGVGGGRTDHRVHEQIRKFSPDSARACVGPREVLEAAYHAVQRKHPATECFEQTAGAAQSERRRAPWRIGVVETGAIDGDESRILAFALFENPPAVLE